MGGNDFLECSHHQLFHTTKKEKEGAQGDAHQLFSNKMPVGHLWRCCHLQPNKHRYLGCQVMSSSSRIKCCSRLRNWISRQKNWFLKAWSLSSRKKNYFCSFFQAFCHPSGVSLNNVLLTNLLWDSNSSTQCVGEKKNQPKIKRAVLAGHLIPGESKKARKSFSPIKVHYKGLQQALKIQ